jgi:hypothetical protein
MPEAKTGEKTCESHRSGKLGGTGTQYLTKYGVPVQKNYNHPGRAEIKL